MATNGTIYTGYSYAINPWIHNYDYCSHLFGITEVLKVTNPQCILHCYGALRDHFLKEKGCCHLDWFLIRYKYVIAKDSFNHFCCNIISVSR